MVPKIGKINRPRISFIEDNNPKSRKRWIKSDILYLEGNNPKVGKYINSIYYSLRVAVLKLGKVYESGCPFLEGSNPKSRKINNWNTVP